MGFKYPLHDIIRTVLIDLNNPLQIAIILTVIGNAFLLFSHPPTRPRYPLLVLTKSFEKIVHSLVSKRQIKHFTRFIIHIISIFSEIESEKMLLKRLLTD